MSDLRSILAGVREMIRRHQGPGKLNEEDTKAALIDPILRGLGWNLEDPDEVRREYRRKPSNKPVDYAFLVRRTPEFFLEAKALGHDLSDGRWANQIMGYASVAGVKWVILTDGDQYRIYNSHAPVPVEEKLFRTVCISGEAELLEETLSLFSKEQISGTLLDELWEAHFVDHRVKTTLEEIFAGAEPEASLVRFVKKKTKDLTPRQVRDSLARARAHFDFPAAPLVVKPGRKRRGRSDRDTGRQEDARKVKLRHLIAGRLIRPPLQIEAEFRDHRFTATVDRDGNVIYDGHSYGSPSAAGGMAKKTIIRAPKGKPYPATDGWTFWRYRTPGGELRQIDQLRDDYVKQNKRQSQNPRG
ncbi:MAG: hypothetical protein ABH877_00050 [bacterium]